MKDGPGQKSDIGNQQDYPYHSQSESIQAHTESPTSPEVSSNPRTEEQILNQLQEWLPASNTVNGSAEESEFLRVSFSSTEKELIKNSPEIQSLLKNNIINLLSRKFVDFSLFKKIQSLLVNPEEIFSQPDIQLAADQSMDKHLELLMLGTQNRASIISYILWLQKTFSLQPIDIRDKGFLYLQENPDDEYIYHTNLLKVLLHYDLIPEGFLESKEEKEKLTKEVCNKITNLDFEEVISDIADFDLPADKIDKMALNLFDFNMYSGYKFIQFLGIDNFERVLPLTYEKIKREIFNTLKSENHSAFKYDFLDSLDQIYFLPFAPIFLAQVMKGDGRFSNYVFSRITSGEHAWSNAYWAEDIRLIAEQEMKETHHLEGPTDLSIEEKNPFEGHDWYYYQGRTPHFVSILTALMEGREEEAINICEKYKFPIDAMREYLPSLKEIDQKITDSYNEFLDQIKLDSKINDEDKISVLTPESLPVKIPPLLETIRPLVIRFIAQQSGSRLYIKAFKNTAESINHIINYELDDVLKEGFEKYIGVYHTDIPLYDKLYDELDAMHEAGRDVQEVYLGRDGIYAWIGRRAQDLARRRKLSPEERKKLRENGELLEIHPKYINYPRLFRDELEIDAKKNYLSQENISKETDPLFYDTGLEGSIPVDIMRILGFSEKEIEQRIRLLSSPLAHRRVRGASKTSHTEIVDEIERNAKTEYSAEGLYFDEKNKKIRLIEMPTCPQDQFSFLMVRQAIVRHYWLQEQLKHHFPKNITFDSKHHSIRVREDLSDKLPPELINNPTDFLNNEGEMILGNDASDWEDVDNPLLPHYQFYLTDGTEAIAKSVKKHKVIEARKEFTALIAAQRAGLPTAEPIGFISGKSENDPSFILMKKVEGIPGQLFEQRLRDSKKYTEEQIRTIMRQVVEKNKDLAKLFREKLGVDKTWVIKDTIVQFDEESDKVTSVIPIDWEEIDAFEPKRPLNIEQVIQ